MFYTVSALNLGTHYFSNGPMMAPPVGANRIAQLVGVTGALWWRPFHQVRSGNRIIHEGAGIAKQFFGRTSSGQFRHYVIDNDPPRGVEAIGGLIQIVRNGAPVGSFDVTDLSLADGIAAWALRPISPAVDT